MFCAHIPKLDSSASCFIQSRTLVLIALTFGQIAVLTVTLFVLWLAEEFGDSHE